MAWMARKFPWNDCDNSYICRVLWGGGGGVALWRCRITPRGRSEQPHAVVAPCHIRREALMNVTWMTASASHNTDSVTLETDWSTLKLLAVGEILYFHTTHFRLFCLWNKWCIYVSSPITMDSTNSFPTLLNAEYMTWHSRKCRFVGSSIRRLGAQPAHTLIDSCSSCTVVWTVPVQQVNLELWFVGVPEPIPSVLLHALLTRWRWIISFVPWTRWLPVNGPRILTKLKD